MRRDSEQTETTLLAEVTSQDVRCNVVCVSEIELNVSDNQVYINVEPLAIKLLPFNVRTSLVSTLHYQQIPCDGL